MRTPLSKPPALADSDHIEVAYPVLTYSQRLDEGTLIHLARTASQKHLLAITWRRSLSEALTDALIGRSSRQIILSVVKNPKAQISESTFSILAEECQRDDVLAEVLAARPDILTLLAKQPEKSRSRFLVGNPHVINEINRASAALLAQLNCKGNFPLSAVAAPAAHRAARCDDANEVVPDIPDGSRVPDVDSTLVEPDQTTKTAKGGRRTVRHKTFLRGCIFFNNRRSSTECLVRDFTLHGARLMVSAAVTVPDVVELYIPQKELTLPAHIKWRTSDEVGVSFPGTNSEPSDHAKTGGMAERVIQLEQQIEALRAPLMQIKRAVVNNRADVE